MTNEPLTKHPCGPEAMNCTGVATPSGATTISQPNPHELVKELTSTTASPTLRLMRCRRLPYAASSAPALLSQLTDRCKVAPKALYSASSQLGDGWLTRASALSSKHALQAVQKSTLSDKAGTRGYAVRRGYAASLPTESEHAASNIRQSDRSKNLISPECRASPSHAPR